MRQKEFGTGDGARNQEREEGHIQEIIGDVVGRRVFFVIHIKHIADASENKIRDAYGYEYL